MAEQNPALTRDPPFVQRRRWLTVDCVEGDFAGFVCEVAALSDEERAPLAANQTYEDLAARMAPLVRAWNVHLPDPASGVPCPLPPPLEAGPAAFDVLDAGLVQWVRRALIGASWEATFRSFDWGGPGAPPPVA